jgi:hypothetical protein
MELLLEQTAETAVFYPPDIGNNCQILCNQIPGYISPNFQRNETENFAQVVNTNFWMLVIKSYTI